MSRDQTMWSEDQTMWSEGEDQTMWSEDPAENPPFHNLCKLFVKHCISDTYEGNKSASSNTNGNLFHQFLMLFRGSFFGGKLQIGKICHVKFLPVLKKIEEKYYFLIRTFFPLFG